MSDTHSGVTARAAAASPKHPGPLVMLVRVHARPDQIDVAQRALEKIAGPTRANPDCLEFRIFQDRDDPQSFTLLEHWVSLEANIEHGKRDYMAEYIATKDLIFDAFRGEFVQEICPPGTGSFVEPQ
ncbi:putative quinol monooxygenase [Nocardia sp. CA-129566]|uniref:putative quinol monooxygenase n=1 Tax=Nocardia sp. CA-129566 TaxID=3239976 RepID=UPI003D992181